MNPAARRLTGPGAITLVMLAILVALGTWQVHRLAWKDGLLADISRAEAAPGVALPPDPPPFLKVRISGVFHYDQTATYGVELRRTLRGDQLGAQLVTPLFRPDGPPVLVDRGWAPSENPGPIAQPSGAVTVEGYVRPADRPGLFSPADDPAKRVFYTLNPEKIGAALGLDRVAPFTVVALGP
ncbi:MAG TPA: SURF1 family protein, partial [Acetobacteraceae bacterium]|nr:SURF1 family protein [Acetobacteraceae bacterium]